MSDMGMGAEGPVGRAGTSEGPSVPEASCSFSLNQISSYLDILVRHFSSRVRGTHRISFEFLSNALSKVLVNLSKGAKKKLLVAPGSPE